MAHQSTRGGSFGTGSQTPKQHQNNFITSHRLRTQDCFLLNPMALNATKVPTHLHKRALNDCYSHTFCTI